MKIKSIASSSSGCCYVVTSGGYSLLIDCGVSLSKIRAALNHDLSKVVGCLVSHDHADHSGFLPQLEKETSISIWCSKGTKTRFDLIGANRLWGKLPLNMAGIFSVLPLELKHDQDPFCECFGFLITDRTKKLFYATDTGEIKYTIPGLSHAMLECNHSFERLIESEQNKAAVKRICETHLDVDQVCEFVSRHPNLEEIHLLHLSDAHSDAKQFKEAVQRVSGCVVKVAKK